MAFPATVEDAQFYLVENPDEVGIAAPDPRLDDAHTTWVRARSKMLKEAVVRSSKTGLTWRMTSDEGEHLRGDDLSPRPLALFTVGMAASYLNEIQALAGQRGIELSHPRLVLNNYFRIEGIMSKGTLVSSTLPPEVIFEQADGRSEAALAALVSDATAASPANGLLSDVLGSQFSLTSNGTALPPGNLAAYPGDRPGDPEKGFDAVKQARAGIINPQFEHGGISPAEGPEEDAAGISLRDKQDRQLNFRAICDIRPDGVKEIEIRQYGPAGTRFKLYSEEAPANGGEGRAPDANTYMVAGIGFCIMTQFGRYSNMAKKNLASYRIVQESHFSDGGASGGSGKPGRAEPLVTHVYLDTSEDDEIAQKVLEMGRQTCFLHAMCETSLRPRIRIAVPV